VLILGRFVHVYGIKHIVFTVSGVIMSSTCEVYLKMEIWMREKNDEVANTFL
jgi:uncharacterized membrane protein YecN with MAPEG domain